MNKNFDLKITPRSQDFSKWYNDLVEKCDLAEHAPVKGCMIIKPYGYAIWERFQATLDQLIKKEGVQNAYFPMFIPKSFLEKEKEHVEGFSPEVAVVTHAGGKKLEEPLIVRPTSETIMYDAYSRWIKSYRDLPLLINQWANIVRWEKRPRLFLRTTEFLWQEGHTAHATHEEALDATLRMLDVYTQFAKEYLAMPVIPGKKTPSEKFAGAVDTYSIEAMMQDGKALQAGTSHLLGQNFAKTFNVQYLDEKNQQQYVHQTSWGVSTRFLGGLFMTHSDDQGLRLPPRIAPIQVVIIPIYKTSEEKNNINQAIKNITQELSDYRVKIDDDDNKSPGWRFNEWEQKGVPIRLEFGPKDFTKQQIVLYRRDLGQKQIIPLTGLSKIIAETLDDIHHNLYAAAEKYLESKTHYVDDWEDFKNILNTDPGFIYAHWCGRAECEQSVNEITKATIRNIPFSSCLEDGKCIKCGQVSKQRVIFAKSY